MTSYILSDLPAELQGRVLEVPRTAALVYLELYSAPGSRTMRQLTRETGLPQRSVRRSLRRLDRAKLVTSSPRRDDPPVSEWSAVE